MTLPLIFTVATQFFNLPKDLLPAICYVESNHKVEQIHKNDGNSHSYGVCQVKLETARSLGFKGTPEELMKPNRNIYYAAKYLQHQLKRYNGNTEKAIIAYNRGSAGIFTNTKYSRRVYTAWRNQ